MKGVRSLDSCFCRVPTMELLSQTKGNILSFLQCYSAVANIMSSLPRGREGSLALIFTKGTSECHNSLVIHVSSIYRDGARLWFHTVSFFPFASLSNCTEIPCIIYGRCSRACQSATCYKGIKGHSVVSSYKYISVDILKRRTNYIYCSQ